MNPYEPPLSESAAYPQVPPPGKITSLDYMRPFQWVFENPNWFMNVLLVLVCMLIPIVGPLVVLGYQFAVIEYLHRRMGATYPDFDFGKFGDMLTRGVWPFLVSLLANLVLVPLFWILSIAMLFCTSVGTGILASSLGEGIGGLCGVFTFFLLGVGFMLLMVLVAVAIVPMVLRAGLAQDFAAGFDFGFVKDFVSKMWKEMFLAFLIYMLVGMVAMLLGFLAFCVGAYFANAYMMLAYSHLLWQLYEVYLSRGGKPIPLKQTQPV